MNSFYTRSVSVATNFDCSSTATAYRGRWCYRISCSANSSGRNTCWYQI